MTATGLSTLDHAPEAVAGWLAEIREELGWDENGRAYLLLRATLHTVRDWLTVDEVAQLAAQLPILIRGIYYDGWNPSSTPGRPRGKEAFLGRIAAAFAKDPLIEPEKAVSAVFRLLENHVSKGEIDQVKTSMRKDIQELWP
jgi:uncharacterized protein (DUF2267 family)